ncbi:MAG: NUDIX hydrolase [Longimicrobiales bacterium]
MTGHGLHRAERRNGVEVAYGGVVIDEQSRVLLREPSDHYGGYVWTFAKGRPDPGDQPTDTALREVREELGVEAAIVAEIAGWFVGTTTDTRMFVMCPVVENGDFHGETARVRWVSFAEAEVLLAQTTSSTGRARDLAILEAARRAWEDHR